MGSANSKPAENSKESKSDSITGTEDLFCFFKNNYRLIDLGYELNNATIMWPGGENFNLCLQTSGFSDEFSNTFYAAGTIKCAEHGGTHVDAPYHFYSQGITVDKIQLNQLVGVCRVISTYQKSISPSDILTHEAEHGLLPHGSIILFNTHWAQNYQLGAVKYLGFDESVQGKYDPSTSKLSFPGINPDAAQLLVERKVAGVGIDTASLDAGEEGAFVTHRILLSNGIYGIENINENINLLPPKGSTVICMPMKISGGSGGPARVCAIIHGDEASNED